MQYNLWYRHTGQAEIAGIPQNVIRKCVRQSEKELIASVGKHCITHMYIRNGVIPHLWRVAPKVSHLWIRFVRDPKQLNR